MEIIEKLTPAETYLIKNSSDSTFKELLKLTLADLCLKKVLKIEDKEVQSHPSNPVRTLKYMSTGQNFIGYKPRVHELVFLNPFQKSPEMEILFGQLIKIAYEKSGSRKRYVYGALLLNPGLTELFHKDFFTKLMGDIALNNHGKKTKEKVDLELVKLESDLPKVIESDRKTALEILQKIGGNVFLLAGLDSELLSQIDKELAQELEGSRGDYGYGCAGGYTFYGDNSDSFDGAFDGADSSGGASGCGGDSGCSGCSGCGGCS